MQRTHHIAQVLMNLPECLAGAICAEIQLEELMDILHSVFSGDSRLYKNIVNGTLRLIPPPVRFVYM